MPHNIVIVGCGIAPWLTACALARAARGGMGSITVVEGSGIDDSLGIPCAIETSLPSTPAFLSRIGIDEDAAIGAAKGSFTLGMALSNWSANPMPSFHAFGQTGASLGPIAFHQLAARLRSEGQNINLANYSIAALCAQSGRFSRPLADGRSVLSTMEYGLHLESAGYAAFLKADALAHGVTAIFGDVLQATIEHGLIASISTSTGDSIEGDLFIDCTGQPAKLISQMAGACFTDWSDALTCNRALTRSHANAGAIPYTHVDAHAAGWQRFADVQNAQGETFVYEAVKLPGLQTDQVPYAFTSGRQTKPWIGNCIAIGGSATIIDPVACTQLALAESAILRLISLLPSDRACAIEAAEYNRQAGDELNCAYDFALLHYGQNSSLPERLAHRIAVYQSCGRVVLHDGELFETQSWIALFEALGITPRRYDHMADGMSVDQITDHMMRVRNVMIDAIKPMPTLDAFIAAHCASAALEQAA